MNASDFGLTEMGLEPLLKVEHLSKQFPQVLANDDISFDVREGEIHCLLGENGAGKSTLAEMLYGVYKPDAGEIFLRGKHINLSSPKDAIQHKIGMVHQHFALIPPFSVVENIVVGTDSTKPLLDLGQAMQELEHLCANYGIALDLKAKIWQLSVGQQQWVEILKALYVGVDLLILDEPTAVLTPQEVERLFEVLQQMKDDGLSIILITHKLKEVISVSDRVTVLRKGKIVDTVNKDDVTKEDLARMMVGREVILQVDRDEMACGEPVLEIKDLRANNDFGREVLRGISLVLHRNEILGLAGVSGNGQKELYDVLIGVRKATGGQVYLDGAEITNHHPRNIAGKGVAGVPEDRIHQGLVMDFGIDENLVLGLHRNKPFSNLGILNRAAIKTFAQDSIERFDIMTTSEGQVTKVLSGGNLQKVILARELSQYPKCLIVSQPTRGLDVGAIEYVHRRLLEQRDNGAGILLISEELEEVFSLATRIAVIYKGQIVGILNAQEAKLEEIGLLMAGIHDGES